MLIIVVNLRYSRIHGDVIMLISMKLRLSSTNINIFIKIVHQENDSYTDGKFIREFPKKVESPWYTSAFSCEVLREKNVKICLYL